MSSTAEAEAGMGASDRPVAEFGQREGGAAPSGVIVVGFDRSAASLSALAKAAELGAHLGAELRVVHAVDLSDYPVDPDVDDWEEQATRALEEESRTVSTTLADYPYGWSYRSVRAEPVEALNQVAQEVNATMIVLGVRPNGWRHRLERLASPSVVQRLISHGQAPVLVVSNRERPRTR